MDINQISGQIVDAAMKVHTALGPGLLESAYEACLLFELHKRGLKADQSSAIAGHVRIGEDRRQAIESICWWKMRWSWN